MLSYIDVQPCIRAMLAFKYYTLQLLYNELEIPTLTYCKPFGEAFRMIWDSLLQTYDAFVSSVELAWNMWGRLKEEKRKEKGFSSFEEKRRDFSFACLVVSWFFSCSSSSSPEQHIHFQPTVQMWIIMPLVQGWKPWLPRTEERGFKAFLYKSDFKLVTFFAPYLS